MIPSIEILQIEFSDIVGRMFDPPNGYKFQTEPSDNGSEHLELIDGEFHLVATERGLELSRRSTKEKDELFFWMASDLAFWNGVKHEFENRIETQDCRRIIFQKQIESIERVNREWAEKAKRIIENTLANNPFNDI